MFADLDLFKLTLFQSNGDKYMHSFSQWIAGDTALQ